jgi:hypothetical protein
MNTTMQQSISTSYTKRLSIPNYFSQFINWCSNQERNRFGWLAIILGVHGCILYPLTPFMIVVGGNNVYFWITAIVAMMMSLVTNLAAMPTKITIPTFALSILIDMVLIAISLTSGLDLSGTYF